MKKIIIYTIHNFALFVNTFLAIDQIKQIGYTWDKDMVYLGTGEEHFTFNHWRGQAVSITRRWRVMLA
jgi:hypothetical protein